MAYTEYRPRQSELQMVEVIEKQQAEIGRLKRENSTTIERCAQVAEQAGNHNYEDDDQNAQYAEGLDYAATAIAAAIRKLKDEP